jgi:hypothetical protein
MIDYIKALFGLYTPSESVQSLLEYVMKHGEFDEYNNFSAECFGGVQITMLCSTGYNIYSTSRFQLRGRFNFTRAEVYWLESKLQDYVVKRRVDDAVTRRIKLNDWLQKQK